jgi:[ribosomal protein S5]-alanine N-acetyltransferase
MFSGNDSYLETARLRLKPIKLSDFAVFQKILTDKFVRRFLCDGEILPPEQIESFIIESEKNFIKQNYGLWLISEKETNQSIGFAGLRTFFNGTQPQLLYALLPEFTGKGFAVEAAKRIVEYGFLELNFAYLEASCDAPNVASHKVAAKLGMRKIKEETKNGLPTIFFRLENGND